MNSEIPKPWEAGYSVAKLPSAPHTKSKAKPGDGRANNGKNFGNRAMHLLSPEEQKLAKEKEKLTREMKKKKQKAIAVRKINAKHLRTAEEVLAEHNFDPMDLLMDVAQGKALYDDHPFLPVLHRYVDDIMDRFEYQDGFGVKGLLTQLKMESWGYLKDSYTPKEHRIKVAMELQKYARPMKKQVEHTGGRDTGPQEIAPLTEAEVAGFKEWFNEHF